MVANPLQLDAIVANVLRRPRIGLRLHGPAHRIRFGNVLADTGADHLTLPLGAGSKAGLDPVNKGRKVKVYGASGRTVGYRVTADVEVAAQHARVPVTFVSGASPLLGRTAMFALWSGAAFATPDWGYRLKSKSGLPISGAGASGQSKHAGSTADAVRAAISAAKRFDALGPVDEIATVLAESLERGDDLAGFAGYWLGRMLDAIGAADDAVDVLLRTRLAGDDDFAAHALVRLGHIYRRLGTIDKAHDALQRAVETGQPYAAPEAAYLLAELAKERGDDSDYERNLRIAAGPWGAISGGENSPVLRARRALEALTQP